MDEKLYIQNNYGHCTKEKCSCLKNGWQGINCEFWKPIEDTSFKQMIERLKKRKE